MYDHQLFVRVLSASTRTLVEVYDVDRALGELTENVTAVFGLLGSGVTLQRHGHLDLAGVVHPAALELEQSQQDEGRGPCLEAIRTGEVVVVPDLRTGTERWPEYARIAEHFGVRSVVGIPLVLADETVGALNLYAAEPRDWSEEELLAAQVLADVVTGYLVNSSKLQQQRQLTEQLQRALDRRMVIEQAKGITAEAHGTGVTEAFELLRRHARSHHTSVQVVADAVVHAGLRV